MDCVVLAAGVSSRMGKNKLLLELGGRTVIERCVGAFRESCARIIVVTGKYHADIERILGCCPGAICVHNAGYRQGMFSSVKTGLRHVASDRFFVTPGDYPFLNADTVNRMADTAGCFVVPVYEGMRGHPILLSRRFVPMMLASEADSMRGCLAELRPWQLGVPVDDAGILRDLDTIDEYNAMAAHR